MLLAAAGRGSSPSRTDAKTDERDRQQVRAEEEGLAGQADDALEEQAEGREQGQAAPERPDPVRDEVALSLQARRRRCSPRPVAPGPTSAQA